jgi:hypothetical protein
MNLALKCHLNPSRIQPLKTHFSKGSHWAVGSLRLLSIDLFGLQGQAVKNAVTSIAPIINITSSFFFF